MAWASASTATSGGAKSASPAPTSITSTPCCTRRRLIAGISAIGYVGSAANRLLNWVTPLSSRGNVRYANRHRYRPLPSSTLLYRPRLLPNPMPREEILARPQHISPVAHDAGRRGEAIENHRAVAFRDDAPVQQHHSPHIHATADQPTESLLQLQSGIRNEIVRESVQPACLQPLEPRRRERLGRDLERELGEDQHAQGPPRHVHAH